MPKMKYRRFTETVFFFSAASASLFSLLLFAGGCGSADLVTIDLTSVRQPDSSLVWLQCPLGQELVANQCTGTPLLVTGERANSLCPAGYRLPRIEELAGLLDDCFFNYRQTTDLNDETRRDVKRGEGGAGACHPCRDSEQCSGLFREDGGWYWTSTVVGGRFQQYVSFFHGTIAGSDGGYAHVRCVGNNPE